MGAIRTQARKFKLGLHLATNLLSSQLLIYSFKSCRSHNVTFKVASSLEDGTGAQLHKQGSIYCLSRVMQSSFVSSPLTSIEIQHGDNFLSDQDVRRHIGEINKALLETDSTHFPENSKEITLQGVPWLDLHKILAALAPNLLLNRPITFRLRQAFNYLGREEKLYYLEFGELLSRGLNFQRPLDQSQISIQTHLRVSTVNPASDRYLPEAYYLKFLHEVTGRSDVKGKAYKIIIHTDFNDSLLGGSNIKWSATPETLEYWKAIGVTDLTGELNLHTMQLAKNILDSISAKFPNVEIRQNSSPIEAWEEMATADYLQISNSSFSFIGAIMNNRAEIYSPKNKQLSMPGWQVS